MSTLSNQLPKETEEYLEERQIPQLMEHLYHELLISMPDDPIIFLMKVLESKSVPQIIIAGPPAGGKGTQCEQIKKKYGVVHVSTGDLLRAEVQKGSNLGKQAEGCMKAGTLVPDTLIIEMVKERLMQDDAKNNGWLLDGFPRTRAQALAMQTNGLIPKVCLVLDVPDEVVIGRISGRRTDPETGATYHVVNNPPPPGVHVEQRADDTPEAISTRLRIFHRNTDEVLDAFHSIAVHFDGTRKPDEIFADLQQHVDATLME